MTTDLRLQLGSAEYASILSSIKPPEVAVSDHNYMAVSARVAFFGMRYAPVKTLGSRNACTVKHPPGHALTCMRSKWG